MKPTDSRSLEIRAIEAANIEKERANNFTRESDIARAKECRNQFLEIFPEIQLSGGYLILCGHKFIPYPMGTLNFYGSYVVRYSLSPDIPWGLWVYDLKSLGEYLIWHKTKYLVKQKKQKVSEGRYSGFWGFLREYNDNMKYYDSH